MKWAKVWMLTVLAVLLGSGTALARDHGHYSGRPHARVGIYFGPGSVWPWYAYPPHYYYQPVPPVVVVPSTPPVYIERTDIPPVVTVPQAMPAPTPAPAVVPPPAPAAVAPAPVVVPESYWYYCSDPQGYYPYVKNCPLGWQRVAPAVPPQ